MDKSAEFHDSVNSWFAEKKFVVFEGFDFTTWLISGLLLGLYKKIFCRHYYVGFLFKWNAELHTSFSEDIVPFPY